MIVLPTFFVLYFNVVFPTPGCPFMIVLPKFLAYEFPGELKHPCRHDAQNDSEVRKIKHTFSTKNNISTTIYSVFFFIQSLIERYLTPLFNEVIF